MFVIDKYNKIKLTKGDTASMYIEVYDLDNKPYVIKSTDIVTLTVRKNASSATAALSKTMSADHYIVINAADTSSLTTGLYIYDVQLTTAEGYVYTIIPTNYFELSTEVTR